MSEKDPYHTYTNYIPARPVKTRPTKVGWALLVAVLLAVLVLALYGTFLLTILKGG